MKKITRALSGVVVIAAGITGAWAHGGATGIVKERMDAMVLISEDTKLIGQMLRGRTSYDPAVIAKAAERITAHSGAALTRLFPEGSLEGVSEASPAIWNDWTRFAALADQLEGASQTLSETASAEGAKKEVAAAFGALAQSCKACHAEFRIEK